MVKTLSSNQLTSKILKFLFSRGVFAWRQNTQGTFDTRRGVYRPAPKTGVPDICAILPPDGQFLGIEIKIGRDKLRPEQIGFQKSLHHVGSRYIVARDYDKFIEEFEHWYG